MDTLIHLATGDRRPFALRLLFARFPVDEQESRLRDALVASERGTLSRDHLVLAEADGVPVGACALVMVQSDGVALVWPPVVSCGAVDETVVEDLLMQDICRRMDSEQARLGQCLLAPDDTAETDLLMRHGFEQAADMFFLARTLGPADELSRDSHSSVDLLKRCLSKRTVNKTPTALPRSWKRHIREVWIAPISADCGAGPRPSPATNCRVSSTRHDGRCIPSAEEMREWRF